MPVGVALPDLDLYFLGSPESVIKGGGVDWGEGRLTGALIMVMIWSSQVFIGTIF